jgi:hypothetical protein
VLEANVLAVAHEQRRLQPYISAALDAPVEQGFHRLIDTEIAVHLSGRMLRKWARYAVDEVCHDLDRVWTEAVTTWLMTLDTPDERLELHRPLPLMPPSETIFPDELTGAEAEKAVHPWDRTRGAGRNCGAQNWSVLEERMGYIVNLFRSRQRHPGLKKAPFSTRQLAAMAAGSIPGGPL